MFALLAALAVLTKLLFDVKTPPTYEYDPVGFASLATSLPVLAACTKATSNTTYEPTPCFIAWSPNTTFVRDVASNFSASQQALLPWSDVFFNDSHSAEQYRNADPSHVFLNIDFTNQFNYTCRMNSTYLPIAFSSGIFKQPLDSTAYLRVFAGLQHALNLEIIEQNGGAVDRALSEFRVQQLSTRWSSVGGILSQLLSFQYPSLLVIAFMPVRTGCFRCRRNTTRRFRFSSKFDCALRRTILTGLKNFVAMRPCISWQSQSSFL